MDLKKTITNVIQNYVQGYHKRPTYTQIIKNMAIWDKIPDISRHQTDKK